MASKREHLIVVDRFWTWYAHYTRCLIMICHLFSDGWMHFVPHCLSWSKLQKGDTIWKLEKINSKSSNLRKMMDENIGTEWWEMDGMWELEWCEMDAIYHYAIISVHCVIYQEWWIQVFPKVLMGNECQEH